jgi:hypothetical protein
MSGTGGCSNLSILNNPELDSSESTTSTESLLSKTFKANSVTRALLPLPPFPQIDSFTEVSPFYLRPFRALTASRLCAFLPVVRPKHQICHGIGFGITLCYGDEYFRTASTSVGEDIEGLEKFQK